MALVLADKDTEIGYVPEPEFDLLSSVLNSCNDEFGNIE